MNRFWDDIRTIFGILLMIAGISLVMLFIVWLSEWLQYGYSWITTPIEATRPDNVQALSKQANDMHESLEALRANVQLSMDKLAEYPNLYGEDTTEWPQGKRDEYQQDYNHMVNAVNAYNNLCATYSSLWQDEWRSIPAPNDLPTSCDMIRRE